MTRARRWPTWALAVVAALGALPAHAQQPPRALDGVHFGAWGREARGFLAVRPWFLARAALLALPLAPPPANSAPETRAELDELLRLEAARTPAQQDAIVRHLRYAGIIDALLDAAGAHPARRPHTRALLEHVERDVRFAVFHAKQRFARARPHQLEAALHPCIHVPAHPAYPSAHATEAHVAALVLALLAPARRAALLAAALEIAHEREIAGVHFPADGVAGRALGAALFALLQVEARFARELDAARAEWP